jgi:hypothetical protein
VWLVMYNKGGERGATESPSLTNYWVWGLCQEDEDENSKRQAEIGLCNGAKSTNRNQLSNVSLQRHQVPPDSSSDPISDAIRAGGPL